MYTTLHIFEYGLFRSFDPWAFTPWVLATYQLQGRFGVVFIDLIQEFIWFTEITVNYMQYNFRNLDYTKPSTYEIEFSFIDSEIVGAHI